MATMMWRYRLLRQPRPQARGTRLPPGNDSVFRFRIRIHVGHYLLRDGSFRVVYFRHHAQGPSAGYATSVHNFAVFGSSRTQVVHMHAHTFSASDASAFDNVRCKRWHTSSSSVADKRLSRVTWKLLWEREYSTSPINCNLHILTGNAKENERRSNSNSGGSTKKMREQPKLPERRSSSEPSRSSTQPNMQQFPRLSSHKTGYFFQPWQRKRDRNRNRTQKKHRNYTPPQLPDNRSGRPTQRL